MASTTTLEEIRARRPDIAAAFESLLHGQVGPTDDYAEIVRRVMSIYGDADREKASVGVEVTSVSAGGVDARYFLPSGARADRRILYIHGGGWVAGGLDGYHALAATLAKHADAAVLLIDYRLAPEHPYPTGLEDCLSAWKWMMANGPSGPSSAERVFLAGDSAGGNLCAALTIKLIEAGEHVPDRLGMIAGTLVNEPLDYIARHDPLSGNEAVMMSVAYYTPAADAADDHLVNPIRASDETLAGFPPTMLQASADEFLLAASLAFGQQLIRHGVRTVISAWPDVPHVWHQFLESLPEADAALAELADFLNREH